MCVRRSGGRARCVFGLFCLLQPRSTAHAAACCRLQAITIQPGAVSNHLSPGVTPVTCSPLVTRPPSPLSPGSGRLGSRPAAPAAGRCLMVAAPPCLGGWGGQRAAAGGGAAAAGHAAGSCFLQPAATPWRGEGHTTHMSQSCCALSCRVIVTWCRCCCHWCDALLQVLVWGGW